MVDFVTNDLLIEAILVLLAISTLISVLDFLGFLPGRIKNWIGVNRAKDTIKTLEYLGMDVSSIQRREVSHRLPAIYAGSDIKTLAINITKDFYISGKKKIGSVNVVDVAGFLDIMSASTDPRRVELIAKILVSFWREQVSKPSEVGSPHVDFVIAPKDGSPLIAYEFARLIRAPLVLHNSKQKFASDRQEFAAVFDTVCLLKAGMVGLIVDDSTTGGAKMLSMIDDMNRYQLKAHDALILFEPQMKKPRVALEAKGVKLHSILTLSDGGNIS